jgi:hypothetical protein
VYDVVIQEKPVSKWGVVFASSSRGEGEEGEGEGEGGTHTDTHTHTPQKPKGAWPMIRAFHQFPGPAQECDLIQPGMVLLKVNERWVGEEEEEGEGGETQTDTHIQGGEGGGERQVVAEREREGERPRQAKGNEEREKEIQAWVRKTTVPCTVTVREMEKYVQMLAWRPPPS